MILTNRHCGKIVHNNKKSTSNFSIHELGLEGSMLIMHNNKMCIMVGSFFYFHFNKSISDSFDILF